MAYGIEEIAKMQVTGPVQGGDMVMKPDQTPVGAAALLNKMQNKNTPGIFKLPMPDKQMPNFMKVAAEGVEEQNTANLENQEIMRIMGQYGVGPEEAKRIYDEMIYGYERDEAAVDPSDWRTILKILEAGGDPGTETETANLWQTWQKIKDRLGQDAADEWLSAQETQAASLKFPGNFTSKEQDVTELPRNLKTGPDNPETELAYITDDEKALLAFMNPGTPHEGPEGVPTYDEGDYLDYKPSGMAGTGYVGPSGAQMSGSQGAGPGTGAIQEAMLESALAGDTGQTYQQAAQEAGYDFAQPAAVAAQEAEIQTQGNINQAIQSLDTSQQNLLNAINRGDETQAKRFMDSGVTLPTNFFTIPGLITGAGINIISGLTTDKKDDTKKETTKEESDFEKLIRNIGGMAEDLNLKTIAGGPFTLFPAAMKMIAEPSKKDFLDNNYKAIMKDKYFNDDGTYKSDALKKDFEERFTPKYQELMESSGALTGSGGGILDMKDVIMSGTVPKGSDLERRLNPTKYFEDNPPRTAQDFKDMAEAQKFGKLAFTHENTAAIEEGRRLLSEQRSGEQYNQRGDTGGPVEKITEEEEVATTTTDPRAGQFNVGGTMPYTDALYTQGTEIDVPLGRRFEIDKDKRYLASNRTKDDIYKYATEGGYSQLEPFQNYLARRREYLGEDEPRYFDEEGNVIYSETV
jgi:hypothetical protein